MIDESFFDDVDGVVVIAVRDKTVNIKTNIYDLEELKGVFTTAYMMALFQDMKKDPDDVDRMH